MFVCFVYFFFSRAPAVAGVRLFCFGFILADSRCSRCSFVSIVFLLRTPAVAGGRLFALFPSSRTPAVAGVCFFFCLHFRRSPAVAGTASVGLLACFRSCLRVSPRFDRPFGGPVLHSLWSGFCPLFAFVFLLLCTIRIPFLFLSSLPL